MQKQTSRKSKIPALAQLTAVDCDQLLKEILDHSSIGMYLAQKTKIIFANEQFKKYLGCSDEEMAGQDIEQPIYPEDREQWRLDRKAMLAGKRTTPYRFRIQTKEDQVRWVLETVSAINYQGRTAILGNLMDVTEQMESEMELRSIKAIEASLLDAIPVAVLGLRNRRIFFANNAVKEILGWEPEELIGKEGRILYWNPEDYDRIGKRAYNIFKTKRIHKAEISCRRKDGTNIICSVTGARIGNILTELSIVIAIDDVTEQKKAEADLKRSFDKLKRSMEDTIQTIAMIVEARDPYTGGHQRAVDKLALAIAKEMRLDRDKVNGIHTAAVIHDIGKIYIPAEMLSKPGRLSEIEFDIMKTHPQVSYDILKRIDFPWPVATIVYQHHERYNGTGYPRGLKGNEILIEARILAVADVVESMASHRPYRPIVGMDKAMEEIRKNRGTLYDPDVADACLKALEKGFKFE